ncbi:MAG TPA: glycoside hydrolase family 16 protein [Longimicrobium sp.]|jgi:beta-glucanase (GH16 family)|uniref:glycoside hydrolase family 16 protein n=1 Tax=Longimicrobium sp. TaxID=2029185 RepID=UPI002ED8932E
MPSHTPFRTRGARLLPRAAAALLLLLAACSDGGGPLATEADTPASAVIATRFADDFDVPVDGRWELDTHALGRGFVRASNVSLGGGAAAVFLAPGAYDGGELRSAQQFGYGSYAARMRTPRAPGSISAFFLYQGGSTSDEIDIELPNDGSRTVMFTTWVAGKQTHTVTLPLPFDPAAEFHEYRIDWAKGSVSFLVDGVPMLRRTRGVPRNPMYVMANAWWPVWMSGPVLAAPLPLEIDQIRAGL